MNRIKKINEYAIIITAYSLSIDTIKAMTEADEYQEDIKTSLGILFLANLRKIIDENDDLTIKSLKITTAAKSELKGFTRVNPLAAALEMISTHEEIERKHFNIGLQDHIKSMKDLVYEDLEMDLITGSKEFGYALTRAIQRN